MTAKEELLKGLRDENREWEGLLLQIDPAGMEEPGVAGYYSVKDVVAHLTGWRRRTVARLQAAQRGAAEPPPPWPAHLPTDDDVNDWIYAENRDRPVGAVLADSQQVFEQMYTAVAGLPDDVLADAPARLPWLEGHALTARELFSHFHDEHEADLRAWIARRPAAG